MAFVTMLATAISLGACSRVRTSTSPSSMWDGSQVAVQLPPVDKIDLLFDIDDSSSMSDKQAFFAQAVPELISRWMSPRCVDESGNKISGKNGQPLTSDANGACDVGAPEFKPIRDIHIGVITTSLGSRGGDLCDPAVSPENDAKGELVDHGTTGNGTTSVGENGCGIESQLESWYRFLIQPDPYNDIRIDGATQTASWDGVDGKIIQQRHDFLRPDSLVAIIVLTDENDSEVDVRSLSGQGYNFMNGMFNPPHGTSACDVNPGDEDCTSCAFGSALDDPNCTNHGGVYTLANDWGYDPNLRHVHMKAKYGIDAQFPIDRYFKGITQAKIPDRSGEYSTDESGAVSGTYVGDPDCTNPLYAAALPDGSDLTPQALCDLPGGFERTPDRVLFEIIGGVPQELLHYDPTAPSSNALSESDWVKILGQDPESYDYAGIDPHMIESYQPRAGLPGPASANDADPISGREWTTNANPNMPYRVDLEYACTFPLAQPRDCAQTENRLACDCPIDASTAPPREEIPPVCDATTPTLQVAAKAYPSLRELLLAKKLGAQGVVASICPRHTIEQNAGDPLFGYRPAIDALLHQMKERMRPLLTRNLTDP